MNPTNAELPYALLPMVDEPGYGGAEIRLIWRLAAGVAHARLLGCSQIAIHLDDEDFGLAQIAHPQAMKGYVLKGNTAIKPAGDGEASMFRCVTVEGKPVEFPVMTDGQYLAAVSLRVGMFVLWGDEDMPRAVHECDGEPDLVEVDGYRYRRNAQAVDPGAPAISHAWDKEAMEKKAKDRLMTIKELEFFQRIVFAQLATTGDAART